MELEPERFLEIVDSAPLVAVDLIIRNERGQVLLGRRTNRPAQGSWFVPGGRIRKNERIAEAIGRISGDELGIRFGPEDAGFLGVYEHLYQDNFLAADSVSTHYVVLAYAYTLADGLTLQPDGQHSEIEWWQKDDLLDSADVHAHTKAYFA